jgi:hypothetical protein
MNAKFYALFCLILGIVLLISHILTGNDTSLILSIIFTNSTIIINALSK